MTAPGLPDLCAVPDCTKPRFPLHLGWEGNRSITSAYCEAHGPQMRMAYCSECGSTKSWRFVWPDGVPPAGVLDGKVGTVVPM